jgi:hypothetical protein
VDAHGDVGGRAIFEELQERNPRRLQLRLRSDEGSERTGVPSKRRGRKLGERERRKLLRVSTGTVNPCDGKGQRPTV